MQDLTEAEFLRAKEDFVQGCRGFYDLYLGIARWYRAIARLRLPPDDNPFFGLPPPTATVAEITKILDTHDQAFAALQRAASPQELLAAFGELTQTGKRLFEAMGVKRG